MAQRTLTITVSPDWRGGLRDAARVADRGEAYAGERLNFESPAQFFGQLTERRWALIQTLLGADVLSVRELARRVGRDVKRVHEDVTVLTTLGLVERTDAGGVVCPYSDVHIDMHLREAV
ncbi:MAG: hypothetical protein ACQERR_09170 [Pseudomonadota bacterium]